MHTAPAASAATFPANVKPEPTTDKEPEPTTMSAPELMPEPNIAPEPKPSENSDQVREPATSSLPLEVLMEYEGIKRALLVALRLSSLFHISPLSPPTLPAWCILDPPWAYSFPAQPRSVVPIKLHSDPPSPSLLPGPLTSQFHFGSSPPRLHQASSSLWLRLGQSLLCHRHGLDGPSFTTSIPPPFWLRRPPPSRLPSCSTSVLGRTGSASVPRHPGFTSTARPHSSALVSRTFCVAFFGSSALLGSPPASAVPQSVVSLVRPAKSVSALRPLPKPPSAVLFWTLYTDVISSSPTVLSFEYRYTANSTYSAAAATANQEIVGRTNERENESSRHNDTAEIQSSDSNSPAGDNMATNGLPFPWSKMRLPNYIVPVHYHLLIHPNLTTLRFNGSVKIEIDVKNNTNWVVLHSKSLKIFTATVLDEHEAHLSDKVLSVLEYPPHEQIAIFSPKILTSGEKYFLYLEFGAPLSDGFYGFYKSTYRTKAGETRVLASTHFEPTSARMALPCFDEPTFKANYTVRIRRGPSHIALSNMPLEQTVEIGNGLFEDQFEASVKMSSYLLAFIVCDFKSVSGITATGINVSIYAVPEKWHQTHYALEAALRLLEFYEQYFNILYPLPKLDLIAIPDFQSGAMENWGLTTYRETSLLYDPDISSASDKLWVTIVIGHELAHQWFGNLVTMEWWNDIWLNEGFARYMEFVSIGAVYPELKVEDHFLDTCFGAIGRDSLNSSRPISSLAENPTQIKEMFDTVSYDKGACILHMLRHFLTDEGFQSGIIRYLRRFRYSNARNEDLWDSLIKYRFAGEHVDLKKMMYTWTLQKGIPLVTVKRKERKLYIGQERFLKIVLPDDPSWHSLQDGYLWHIPLTYKTSHSNHEMKHILHTKSDVLTLDDEVDWVKLNTDMNGYYIVHYDEEGWNALTELLRVNHTALSFKDRASLIHNAFQLVTAGRLSLERALDLISYLKSETHNVPLLQGIGYLQSFYKLIEKRNIADVTHNLKMYILQYFRDVIDKQSWSDDGTVSDRRLREEVLSLACDFGYPPCLEKAKQLYDSWVESNGTISLPTDVSETVYMIGAQDDSGWAYLLEKYGVSMCETEKSKFLSALASSKDTEKLSRFPLGSFGIRNIIVGTVTQFSSTEELREVEAFFKSITEQVSQLRVTQVAIENVEKNIMWLRRNLETMRNWLQQRLN
ncbi:Endoplasmic reticulum aminopeptidase 2 [Anabarilius grahami]|uniref:Endoplasmic reticulum aminopeptidase 2 n=1 Tax=Anabarilius grahami TaxID=495550 RepID=A0A3N0Y9L1_ANAGA|nr:Endoplasmic reticulum aminopeptidase 2 [Anabarilius grahami]